MSVESCECTVKPKKVEVEGKLDDGPEEPETSCVHNKHVLKKKTFLEPTLREDR